MKSKNSLLTLILVAGMSLNLFAYNSGVYNATKNSVSSENVMIDVSKEQAQKILDAYLKIKDALVKTDGAAASLAAQEIVTLLGDGNDDLVKKLRTDAKQIMDSKDANQQRAHFNTLSDNVYALVKSTSANQSTIYRQYCPMASGNKGAYWLSTEKEIANPYFGDKMLRCGSVKEEL